jgi:phosphohistidine phosphatase
MKTLLITRHAKAIPGSGSLPDHDRPLQERGRAAAQRMGQCLKERELAPELIVSSTAIRAASTASIVANAVDYAGEVILLRELYLAEPRVCLEVLRRRAAKFERVMLVGHNPGLELLASLLGGEEEVSLPTGAVAQVAFDGSEWALLEPGSSTRLVSVLRPKELG